jgi:hypothetical protein
MNFILIFLIFLSFQSSVLAQEFFSELAAPAAIPSTNVRFTANDEPGIKGDRDQSHFDQQKFFIATPVNKVLTDPASVSWKWSQLGLGTELRLPSGQAVPSRLYESEYGLSYRHYENESKFWGATASFGSASDRPFAAKENTTLSATLLYSNSIDPVSRWVWLLNYSNNRSFANEIPLPGFAYIYRPSKELFTVIGFPFAFLRYQINETWNTQIFLGPYVYKLELAKTIFGPYQAYTMLDSSLQNYYLDQRIKKENRLFIAETKSVLGFKGPISKVFYWDINAGLAFGRSISESENYKIDKTDHLLLENRLFVGSQISARF